MAQPSSMKVVEVCWVAPKPSSPDSTSPDDQSLPLTFFDLLWLRFPPIQRVFFYEISSFNTLLFFDSILPKLKASLSPTLQHFLPLAGNLTWPQDSQKPFLSYVKVSHDQAAVMALQITIFPNCGFSIGSAVHHAALDGKTSTSFLKHWAHLCKHGGLSSSLLPEPPKPCYDRRAVKDPAGIEAIYLKEWLNAGGPNNTSLMSLGVKEFPLDSIRGTFEFTRAKIEALRQSVMTMMAKKKQQDHSVLHLSTFSLTCAYTWVCLVKAEEIKAEKVLLVFSADCRSRLDPPLPATYFGNCIAGRGVVAETKGLLGEDGLFVALNAISESIKSLDKTVLDGPETWVSRMLNALQTTHRVHSIAGSHTFGIYEATDFGWGRPTKIDFILIDRTGAISFSDSKNGAGGVEVGLVFKKHYMEAFASLFARGLEDL
ncbi:unnamed protein product [Prunus armeniaca]|uniref:Uncharacterized protein n=1 Tax=Prunus armeniaca TaxID=36596 RepID=A0A6J5WYZ9_PRUAR|nr:unnamed protein product [Prunus armeniaca]